MGGRPTGLYRSEISNCNLSSPQVSSCGNSRPTENKEKGNKQAYVDHRVLALNASHQLLLLNVHNQILALEVAGYASHDNVDVADCLGPAVGEGLLLSLLLGASRGIFSCSGFWR